MKALLIGTVPVSITLALTLIANGAPSQGLPTDLVGFQRGDKHRSSLDIILSCISTIIICVITAMHFNVPEEPRVHRLEFGKKIQSVDYWKDLAERVSLYAAIFLVPEVIVSLASTEYAFALHDRDVMQTTRSIEGWTLKHSFFAQMGGFTIGGETVHSGTEILSWGVELNKGFCENLGYEINDKSKADLLAKLLAITQISRFLLETISRAVHSYPISPLEYFTCAQVICALMTYYLWFHKPRNVLEPIQLMTARDVSLQNVEKKRFSDLSRRGKHFYRAQIYRGGSSIFFPGKYATVVVPLIAVAAVGASALASWKAQYRSSTAHVLWTTCNVVLILYATVLPLLFFGSLILFAVCIRRMPELFVLTFAFSIVIVYIMIRCFIVVLLFYAFTALPVGAYMTESWVDFIPSLH